MRCTSYASYCSVFVLLTFISLASSTVDVETFSSSSPGQDNSLSRKQSLLRAEVNTHLSILGQVSDDAGSLVRTFLSPAHIRARTQIAAWMQEAGMHVWTDSVANVHGRINGENSSAPVLLIGSHYDSVKDAGKFDGALGILAGIAAVKALIVEMALETGFLTSEQADRIAAGTASVPDFLGQVQVDTLVNNPVEVVAFCDEEGLRLATIACPWLSVQQHIFTSNFEVNAVQAAQWAASDSAPSCLPEGWKCRPCVIGLHDTHRRFSFQTTLLGSRALAGSLLQPTNALKATGADGQTVQQVLEQHGFDTSEAAVTSGALKSDQVAGYVEVHLEQGPVLEALGKPLGVVTSIAGQTRLSVSVTGTQGHAGTVPMRIRRDPLAAAAEAISTIEQLCGGGGISHASAHQSSSSAIHPENAPSYAARDPSLVCTVGSISIWPGASNVIPGSANFSVDIRSQNDEVREAVVNDVTQSIYSLSQRRHVRCLVERKHDEGAVQCSPALVERLIKAVKASEQVNPGATQTNKLSSISSTPQAKAHLHDGATDMDTVCEASGLVDGQCTNPDSGDELSGQGDVPKLVSGAGHDGLAMSELTSVGMLFVRCRGGISHSPLEYVSDEDVGQATLALLLFLKKELL